jgi:predicted DNA-binding protein YlxM (UPF0122 family)
MLQNIMQNQALKWYTNIFNHFRESNLKSVSFIHLSSQSIIASNYNITVEAVKQNIKRSVQKLELDNSDALRVAYSLQYL